MYIKKLACACFFAILVCTRLFLELSRENVILKEKLSNKDIKDAPSDDEKWSVKTTKISSMKALYKHQASFGFDLPSVDELAKVEKMGTIGKYVDIYKDNKIVLFDEDNEKEEEEAKVKLVKQGLTAAGASENQFVCFDCNKHGIGREFFTSIEIDYTDNVITISNNPDVIICKNVKSFDKFSDIKENIDCDNNTLSQSEQRHVRSQYNALLKLIAKTAVAVIDSRGQDMIKTNEHHAGIQQLALFDKMKTKKTSDSTPVTFHCSLMPDCLPNINTSNYAYYFIPSDDKYTAKIHQLDCITMYRWIVSLGTEDTNNQLLKPFPSLPSWYMTKQG